jgi:hypothetical protein
MFPPLNIKKFDILEPLPHVASSRLRRAPNRTFAMKMLEELPANQLFAAAAQGQNPALSIKFVD